nr:MAG TPA: hypothetical protein [Caudoviricetes sp.]
MYFLTIYNHPTTTRSNTRNLRSHTVLSFTRGEREHTLPVGQSGGTGVQLTQTSHVSFWRLNDVIIIVYLSHSSICSEQV